MIISKEIEILLNQGNIPFYKKYTEYKNNKKGDIISVPIDKIGKVIKILVKCDICGRTKEKPYGEYLKCTKNNSELYVCKKCVYEKVSASNIKKYGVKNVFELKEKKEKIKKTNLEKYGSESHNSSQIIKDRKKELLQEKYGVDNIFQLEEIKEKSKKTMLEKYGVEFNMQLDQFKDDRKKTYLKNYGVDNPTKNIDILNKSLKSGKKYNFYKETKLYYQASYELDFLEHCEKINILQDIKKPIKMISFKFLEKDKKYLPDFILNENTIIEIKSLYWYKYYKDLCEAKREACLNLGYKYFLIIDKNYEIFDKYITN